ncbi:hypothetical protein K439DRAFT_1612926 [Ramaria rubella]|nr:hypothetical protein K439DRAFT_1612926 [Ramaria rubella]
MYVCVTSDPNGKYEGRWLWDEERQYGHGNPAESTEVDEVITSVKNRKGAEGTRSHSCAMTKEYMDSIMGWSNQQCPPETLRVLSNLQPSDYHQCLPIATKHHLMRAFAASGWTIWTRNFELTKLQYKHIVEDAYTDDRYRFRHLLVTLENCKGWQHKLSQEADLYGHKYEIHPQCEMPSVYMEFHFLNPKGLIQPGTPISHDTIQKWMDEFVIGTSIVLRLGCPVSVVWSLATICWWGGWAEGEHDTLIHYLLDELYYYEEGHGDALRPISRETVASFLGEMHPATKHEIQEIIGSQLDNMRRELTKSYHSIGVIRVRRFGRFDEGFDGGFGMGNRQILESTSGVALENLVDLALI